MPMGRYPVTISGDVRYLIVVVRSANQRFLADRLLKTRRLGGGVCPPPHRINFQPIRNSTPQLCSDYSKNLRRSVSRSTT